MANTAAQSVTQSNQNIFQQFLSTLTGTATSLGVGNGILTGTGTQSNNPYGSNLIFPTDLEASSNNVWMSFTFYKYQRRSIFDQPFLGNMNGTVVLPPPKNLIDDNRVDFSQAGISDPATGAAIEGALNAQEQGTTVNLGQTVGNIASNLPGAAGVQIAKNLINYGGSLVGIQNATGQFGQVLGGVAQNPFLTVLFNAPYFKRHHFTWRLAPYSEDESNVLYNIINTFRWNMLPYTSGYVGGTLLAYPNMVVPYLHPTSDTGSQLGYQFLYRFKPCVIENATFNFAPGTTPAFYNSVKQVNQKPAMVDFSLTLLEIEYWLQPDVANAYPVLTSSSPTTNPA